MPRVAPRTDDVGWVNRKSAQRILEAALGERFTWHRMVWAERRGELECRRVGGLCFVSIDSLRGYIQSMH